MNIKDQLTELMHNVAEDIKNRWDFYRHAAYLKRRGWSEDEYQRYEDPDTNSRASRVKDYYHGYPYITAFDSSRGDPWTRYPTWIDAYQAIETWCKENCKDKWRTDIFRVIKSASTNNEWEMNDIGGGDALFFAFKSQEDCFMFMLKWGGE